MTERARYTFRVKEFADGAPWVLFEPQDAPPNGIAGGTLGFDLPDGTTLEEAQQLADTLNVSITSLSFTADH